MTCILGFNESYLTRIRDLNFVEFNEETNPTTVVVQYRKSKALTRSLERVFDEIAWKLTMSTPVGADVSNLQMIFDGPMIVTSLDYVDCDDK